MPLWKSATTTGATIKECNNENPPLNILEDINCKREERSCRRVGKVVKEAIKKLQRLAPWMFKNIWIKFDFSAKIKLYEPVFFMEKGVAFKLIVKIVQG